MSSEGETYLDLRPGIDTPQVRRSKAANEAMKSNASVALNVAAPSRRASRLPKQVQFPLIVILSFSMSSLGYSMLNEGTKGELVAIAKAPESKYQVALLAAWRIFELAIGWYGNLDGYDLAALNVLSHGPSQYLAAAFYDISPWTAGACLAIDSISSLVPFLLLRPVSESHAPSSTVPNKEIIVDRTITLSTGLLAGLIYAVTFLVAVKTSFSTNFVLYFPGITRIEPALDSTYGFLTAIVLMGLFGIAAHSFIFTPFEATGRTAADTELEKFDPASATLAETLRWNAWGYHTRTKVAILRTATVMLLTWVSTFLQCYMTIKGVEAYGAAAYASIWALAAMATGTALELVGDV